MFSNDVWKIMYNNVFKLFPSPDTIQKKIILKTDNDKMIFNSTAEFLSYLCMTENDNVLNDDVDYILEDVNLKKEIEKNILKIIKKEV